MRRRRQEAKNLLPMSPWLLGSVLLVAVVVVIYLVPSERTLLERHVRDGATERALEILKRMPLEERERNAREYALLELQLRRKLLAGKTAGEVDGHWREAVILYEQHGFRDDFFEELRQVLPLLKEARGARSELKRIMERMPVAARRRIYSELAAKALAEGDPTGAAEIFEELASKEGKDDGIALEGARLWRMAGRADAALATLERNGGAEGAAVGGRATNLDLLRVQLLRETGQAVRAFEAVRELHRRVAKENQAELFGLLVETSRQAGRSAEVLEAVKEEAARTPQSAESWRLLGTIALEAERLDVAIEAHRQVMTLEPGNEQNAFKLGQLYEWSNQPGTAFEQYQRALKLRRFEAIDRLMALAPGLYREAELAEALSAEAALVFERGHGLALARLQASVADYPRAQASYEKLLTIERENTVVLMEYGSLLMDLMEYERALATFTQLSRLQPSNTDVWRALAEVNFRLDNYEASFDWYRQLDRAGTDALAGENYITLAESLGRVGDVIAGLRERVNRGEEATARDYQRLGYYLTIEGRADESREVLVRGAKRFPENPGLCLQAAYALGDAGEHRAAAELLERQVNLRRDRAMALFYTSALAQAGEHDRADLFLRSGLDGEVLKRPEMLELRAEVLQARGQSVEAVELWRTLHEQAPENGRYVLNYARGLSDAGQGERAVQVLEAFLKKNSSREAVKLAAEVYASVGQYKTAEKFQRRYLAMNPEERASAFRFLGDILLSRGDKIHAKRAYEQGLNELLSDLSRKQRE